MASSFAYRMGGNISSPGHLHKRASIDRQELCSLVRINVRFRRRKRGCDAQFRTLSLNVRFGIHGVLIVSCVKSAVFMLGSGVRLVSARLRCKAACAFSTVYRA